MAGPDGLAGNMEGATMPESWQMSDFSIAPIEVQSERSQNDRLEFCLDIVFCYDMVFIRDWE